MKTIFLHILALAIILTACGKADLPATFSEETEALFREYVTYLSGNYEEGDTLSYEIENGDIERMRVESCYSGGRLIIVTEKEGEDEDEKRKVRAISNDYVQDYRITTVYLTERMTECTGFGAAIQLLPSGEQINHVDIRTNRETVSPLRTPAPAPTDNTLVLQTDAGWCVLERGVGIVQIADTLGHTWKLVE